MKLSSYNTCWNRIIIKDIQGEKNFQNYIEGEFAFTERTKANFMKDSLSEKGLQICKLLNISSFLHFFEPHLHSRYCTKCYGYRNEQKIDLDFKLFSV